MKIFFISLVGMCGLALIFGVLFETAGTTRRDALRRKASSKRRDVSRNRGRDDRGDDRRMRDDRGDDRRMRDDRGVKEDREDREEREDRRRSSRKKKKYNQYRRSRNRDDDEDNTLEDDFRSNEHYAGQSEDYYV